MAIQNPRDLYIPFAAVQNVEADEVVLKYSWTPDHSDELAQTIAFLDRPLKGQCE
jgi:hypothetical protein